uniref:Uncharacterized protein n=1 Tax=Anopheles albimanus TaxID=7167 RepID=A0A182FW21_ANOAL
MSKLLSLHRPTVISKLSSLVPEHGETYPSGANVPPQWHDLLPSQKLPDRRFPSVPTKQLAHRSLANPLWHLPHGHGFDLTDPHLQITRRTYHPLHDEHLQRFWRDTLKQNITEGGLIDDEGKVVCTLQEFNQWRAFLFQHRRSEAGPSRSMPDHKRRSKVSIGPISIVAQYEVTNSTFKNCKERPPTPITSVTSLVACTMQETELERRITSTLEVSFEMARELEQRIRADDYPLIHVMYSQRRYLEGNLLKYRMIVQPYVDQRVLASIDVDQLAVNKRKWCGVSRDRLLHRTAIGLLKFPESNQQYAKAMLDCINYLTVQAANEAQQILNDP